MIDIKINSAKELEKLRSEILSKRDPKKQSITICSGTGCHAYGCDDVSASFDEELKKQKLDKKVDVKRTGCHGFCERGVIVVIYPQNICYLQVKLEDIPEIVSETIGKGKIIDRLVYKDDQAKYIREAEIPFYKNQQRLIFKNNPLLDPRSIEDYIALGGYSALVKALTMKPEVIIEEVKKSNIRGRGGAGFPTGRKWESTRIVHDEPKYVVANCDEGDPGAYMDRSLMEGNPHSVIEGMIIGAFAIGAHEGYLYIREEYPLAVDNTNFAIRQARECGLLGKNILGFGFDFDLKVFRGAGAFVSGESSALMQSIEGSVGEPVPKYIHLSEKGLWEKPTNLNNIETWANIPFIVNNGADWFLKMGTQGSKGTKIFSLVGNVKNTGLVEVPMGITLRDIVFKIGGGIKNDKKFKAVQTGGPSGGCIPEFLMDTSIDYDELTKLGSMMGSGGMIVMDESTCMPNTAKYFIEFLKGESCGKCVPCREGIKQMANILNRICDGRGEMNDLKVLEDISNMMVKASLCQLGVTAPNPVMSTIKYFKDEYIAHIKDKKCPAGVCKTLITFTITDDCTGCGVCALNCPQEAVSGEKKQKHIIDQSKCIKCGICLDNCKFNAIIKE